MRTKTSRRRHRTAQSLRGRMIRVTVLGIITTLLYGLNTGAGRAGEPEWKEGLVGHWRFDTISKDNTTPCALATEQSAKIIRSNRIEGEFNPRLEEGIKGKALRCGNGGQYGYFAAVAEPPPFDGDFSITFWTKPRGSQWMTQLFYFKRGWHLDEGISLDLSGINLSLVLGGNRSPRLTSRFPLPAGSWAFIGLTWDGQTWKLYHNSMPAAEEHSADHPFRHPGEAVPIHIGGYNVRTNNIYQGMIDQFRIWDRALNKKSIQKVMLHDADQKRNEK